MFISYESLPLNVLVGPLTSLSFREATGASPSCYWVSISSLPAVRIPSPLLRFEPVLGQTVALAVLPSSSKYQQYKGWGQVQILDGTLSIEWFSELKAASYA